MFVRFNVASKSREVPLAEWGAVAPQQLQLILYISICQGRAKAPCEQTLRPQMGRCLSYEFQRYWPPTLRRASRQVDIIRITPLSWDFLNKTMLFTRLGWVNTPLEMSLRLSEWLIFLGYFPVREIILMSTTECKMMTLRLMMSRFCAVRSA